MDYFWLFLTDSNNGIALFFIITGELDFSVMEKIRNSINVYKDRRPDVYELE